MAPSYKIDNAKLTVVLTSCGRFDLLEKTLISFLSFFDARNVIIGEDSGDAVAAAEVAAKFPQVEIRLNA